ALPRDQNGCGAAAASGLFCSFLIRRFVLGDFRFRALQAGLVGIARRRRVGNPGRRRAAALLLRRGLAACIVAATRRALASAVVALAVHARHRAAIGIEFDELVGVAACGGGGCGLAFQDRIRRGAR